MAPSLHQHRLRSLLNHARLATKQLTLHNPAVLSVPLSPIRCTPRISACHTLNAIRRRWTRLHFCERSRIWTVTRSMSACSKMPRVFFWTSSTRWRYVRVFCAVPKRGIVEYCRIVPHFFFFFRFRVLEDVYSVGGCSKVHVTTEGKAVCDCACRLCDLCVLLMHAVCCSLERRRNI